MLTPPWQMAVCTVIHWLNTALQTAKKYAVVLYILIKKTGFKIAEKNHQFFGIPATPLSVHISTLPVNFHMECMELRSNIQLKKPDCTLISKCVLFLCACAFHCHFSHSNQRILNSNLVLKINTD